MNRAEQLDALASSLSQLIAILALDPRCQWRRHFEQCLSSAEALRSGGFVQSQLNALSGSVRCVYGGMGSFNDYAPLAAKPDGSFGVIPGMDGLESSAGNVYESALALMVVEGGLAL